MAKKKKNKKERLKMSFGIFVSILMITSLGGYFVNNQQDSSNNGIKVTIGGKEYTYKQGENSYLVESDILGKEVKMFFLPEDLTYIEFPQDIGSKLASASSVILSFDPDEIDLSYQEQFRIQMNYDFIMAGKGVDNAIINQSETYNEYPIYTCANATQQAPVMMLKNSDITKIYSSGNCIYVNANNVEYFKIRDLIAQYIFGFAD